MAIFVLVKTIRNILSTTFLSFFMLMTIGAPYYMHTCQISLEKDIHLFVASVCEDVETHCGFHTSCHDNEKSSSDEDCCEEEEGYVQFDYDGPAVNVAIEKVFFTFVSINVPYAVEDFSFADTKYTHQSNAPPLLSSGRSMRIAFQSFLC